MSIKFCNICGAEVEKAIPRDDDHVRAVCTRCGNIQYENPKMVVGCLPVLEDRILMCRRNIEPRKGMWTLPAGYLENGESVQDGAVRESFEETGSRVRLIAPYRMFNIVFVRQIYLIFRADLLDENFGPTTESLEVKLFDPDRIPWDEMAFEVIRQTLKDYLSDRKNQAFDFRIKDLAPPPAGFKLG
ncbi:NUDIX hydrolase [Desulfospira joergensenii]|uniref:NUDIX hydrolase n=1 Tax=Desulfospira joergensenii TaxID=53329 RepID=UPI0003B7B014|nr:NUDIX hydrolase [Desulfospira joergensenii]